ncbi:MAG: ribosomal-protein-alanine N-acetyltransferase, partial [Bacteroides xylanisolvens]
VVMLTTAAAIALYMKIGFIPAGIMPCYYLYGSDAIYMQRLIQ